MYVFKSAKMEGIDIQRGFDDLIEVDENIIEGKPWAKKLWDYINKGHRKSFLNWCQIVIDLEEKEDVINHWVEAYKREFETMACDLVVDIGKLKAGVISEIEELLIKLQNLCTNLSIEMEPVGSLKLCLYKELSMLKRRVQEYEVMEEARLKEIHLLMEKQRDVCRQLGRVPKVFKESPLPSRSTIDEWQRYIEDLESEKFNRLEEFCETKMKIRKIVDKLRYVPSTDFERDVCSEDDSKFLVTDDNMKMLKEFLHSMQKLKKSVSEQVTMLRQKIDDLWNILDVGLLVREEFTKTHSEMSLYTLEALKEEVKRCEELKRANIRTFIEKYRQDLLDIWTKCLVCVEEKKREFEYFYSDTYSEDLLEIFEHEIAVWKRFYADNERLFLLIEEHKKMWQKAEELEENSRSQNRYKNRGGQLLKEEKERNKLSKKIPLLEAEMLEEAAKFKLARGHDFLISNKTVEEFIGNLHEMRERTKKLKLSARKQERDQTIRTPSKCASTTSRIRLFPSTSNVNLAATPGSASKRKLMIPHTPATAPSLKKIRVDSELKAPLSARNRIVSTALSRAKRLSMERKKRIEKCRRISQNKENREVHQNTLSTEYEQFEMRPLAYSSVCEPIPEV